MTASGDQCVMMSGTSEMLRWCAEPWTVGQLRQPNLVPTLVKAQEASGWMMSAVSVTRRPLCTADIPPSEKIIVAMVKMPAWCAQVESWPAISFISQCFYAYIYLLHLSVASDEYFADQCQEMTSYFHYIYQSEYHNLN